MWRTIHNVKVTARVMYMTTTITSVYGHCIDTAQTSTTLDTRTCLGTLYTMLTIVRGCTRPLMLTSEHTLIEISYPYMVIFRRYIASVSYWLAPMYVEYSGIDFQYSSQHVHNVSHTAQVYNALYTYCGGCAGFTLYSVHSIVYICVVYIIYIYIYSLYSLYYI